MTSAYDEHTLTTTNQPTNHPQNLAHNFGAAAQLFQTKSHRLFHVQITHTETLTARADLQIDHEFEHVFLIVCDCN